MTGYALAFFAGAVSLPAFVFALSFLLLPAPREESRRYPIDGEG